MPPQTFTKVGLSDLVTKVDSGWLRMLQNWQYMGAYHFADYGDNNVITGLDWFKGKLKWEANSTYYTCEFFEVPDVTIVRTEGEVEAHYLLTKIKYALGGYPYYAGQWVSRPLPGPGWYDKANGLYHAANGIGRIGPCPVLKVVAPSAATNWQQYPPMLSELIQIDPCLTPGIPNPEEDGDGGDLPIDPNTPAPSIGRVSVRTPAWKPKPRKKR